MCYRIEIDVKGELNDDDLLRHYAALDTNTGRDVMMLEVKREKDVNQVKSMLHRFLSTPTRCCPFQCKSCKVERYYLIRKPVIGINHRQSATAAAAAVPA